MLKIAALKLAEITGNSTYRGGRRRAIAQSQSRWREWVLAIAILSGFPSVVAATHEADHRFTVEGYVCGVDGKSSANVDVLVKDTKISYGQIVKTDGDGHYKASFHLHNDNLGDPLLIEANGQQQHQKVSFDPKDLEAERIIQVNFGTGCAQDRSGIPLWVYLGAGAVAAVVGGFIGLKLIRSWRKQEQKRGKSLSKRKK
jgi:4-amino-4-deoxy-L-arabinose transferase-like glycosyltransferase